MFVKLIMDITARLHLDFVCVGGGGACLLSSVVYCGFPNMYVSRETWLIQDELFAFC